MYSPTSRVVFGHMHTLLLRDQHAPLIIYLGGPNCHENYEQRQHERHGKGTESYTILPIYFAGFTLATINIDKI